MNPGGLAPGGMDLYGHFAAPVRPELACPHCRGISQIAPNDELAWVCSICGGPRIRMPEGMAASPGVDAALRKAEAARKSRGFMRTLTILGALGSAFGVLASLLGGALGGVGVAIAVGAVIFLPCVVALLVALTRAGTKGAELEKALDAAWALAAAEVIRAGKAATPADLANALGIDPARAEQLHAMQSLDASLAGAPGVRVGLPPDPRFEALERRVRVAEQGSAPETAAMQEAEAEAESAAHGTTARATGKPG